MFFIYRVVWLVLRLCFCIRQLEIEDKIKKKHVVEGKNEKSPDFK